MDVQELQWHCGYTKKFKCIQIIFIPPGRYIKITTTLDKCYDSLDGNQLVEKPITRQGFY